VSPSLSAAIGALGRHLDAAGYTPYSRDRIVAAAVASGTPTACDDLCDEDEAEANEVWVENLPEVPYSSSAWDADQSVPLDVELLSMGVHPFPVADEPPDGPDAPDYGMSRSAALGELIRCGHISALPPISGGSPDAGSFQPSQSDWDDYAAWSRTLEARYAAAESARVPTAAEVRAWLDANEHTRPDYDPAA
jgi:hypothetical protein